MKLVHMMRALLFPPACAACGELLPFDSEEVLCTVCRGKWEEEKRRICPDCGKPISECECPVSGDAGLPCVSLAFYDPRAGRGTSPVKEMLLSVKEARLRETEEFLAGQLADRVLLHLGPMGPETVIAYVPRNPAKARVTGTDQARAIAAALADRLGLSVCPILIRRRGRARDQKTLDAAGREKNASSAYRLSEKEELREACRGKRVLLFDDIITSGATVSACAALLSEAGAEDVIAVSVARTLREGILRTPERE